MPEPTGPVPTQTLPVYPAAGFVVTEGVARGDGLSFADDLVMDDIYQLTDGALRGRLGLAVNEAAPGFLIAEGSELGRVGNPVYLDCCITLMAPDSTTYEGLVLVEVEAGTAAATYLLPLATLARDTPYRLVRVDREVAPSRLATVACVSFTRGTHITLWSGAQVRIEDLNIGDRVLTRDDGAQAVRWIGQTTLRATGAFSPIVIRKGTLHNTNDLLVSPDHRLFVYQRSDHLGAGRAEVLVKVRHLVNGDTVAVQDGGFIDYFQLLFDEHQIIYAEGIAAESLLIDPRTRAALPDDVAGHGHGYRQHQDYEVHEGLLMRPDTVALLRRASSG